MTDIRQQRCYHHARREAVARCPACRRFYCRECTTEHEGRMLCASCLARRGETPPARRCIARAVSAPAALCVGVLAGWLFFLLVGQALLRLPDAFHRGRPAPWFEATPP